MEREREKYMLLYNLAFHLFYINYVNLEIRLTDSEVVDVQSLRWTWSSFVKGKHESLVKGECGKYKVILRLPIRSMMYDV